MRYLVSLLFVLSVSAQARVDRMETPKAPAKTTTNLIDESTRLRVLQEESVQRDVERPRRTYGLSYSRLSADRMILFSNEQSVSYSNVERSAIGGKIGYMPFHFARGYWGLISNIHYSYTEKSDIVKTALHWTVADINIAYRMELSERAWVKPFAALGGGYNVLVQRGPTDYNTSEARGIGLISLGANFNLSRLFALQSPLNWELTAQYRNIIHAADARYDFSGDQYSLGLELSL